MTRSALILAAVWVLGLVAAGCGHAGGTATSLPPDTAAASGAGAGPQPDEITVAAAADLRLAFEDLGASFEAATGTKVTFSFGSSGQLAEQIINGAPFDAFASADVGFVDEVIAEGKADGSTKATYAFGRIVVYSPSDGPDAVTTLEGLAGDHVRHVAIANPDHAPYGVAAEQALRSAGVHDVVSPKLVLGANVSDALQLASTGNADAAIVALSLVKTRDGGTWALIGDDRHEPLEQALVVTGVDPTRTEAARAFAAYVNSPAGRAVMNAYGFVLPDEDPS